MISLVITLYRRYIAGSNPSDDKVGITEGACIDRRYEKFLDRSRIIFILNLSEMNQ